eukprot:613714-Amphidinium_carterae.1
MAEGVPWSSSDNKIEIALPLNLLSSFLHSSFALGLSLFTHTLAWLDSPLELELASRCCYKRQKERERERECIKLVLLALLRFAGAITTAHHGAVPAAIQQWRLARAFGWLGSQRAM